MKVVFNPAVVSEYYEGTSKAGNTYGVLTFLDSDYKQFRVFVSGNGLEVARKIPLREACVLEFELTPDRNGGVRLALETKE